MDLLADLNEPQRTAVQHDAGPLLVLAGAGSGKTRVITRRLAWLVSRGVAPWNLLAITFTNKAAGEMRERVEALGVRGATVCTFHALCARLLREFALEAGLAGDYSIYDRADQLRIVKEATERLDLPTDRLAPAAVHSAISNAKNDLLDPQAYASRYGEGDFYTRHVAAIYREYQRLLSACNALDFDDLLLRTAVLLGQRQDLRQLLGQRFRYVMIDEYQDTNRAQYVIAHAIALDHQNIAVTGDPDQSIYAWRGADIRNILEFERDYPNATVVRLEENYRSRPAILAAAGALISHNRMRKDKALWTRRPPGRDVRVLLCEDEHAEARAVARRIIELRAGGATAGEIAVFYRVNALSRVMEDALRREGIAYRIARGTEFYNRKEVKDVLGYLKLLVNPADDLSCQRVINMPARGIGATTLERLSTFAASSGVGLLEACRHGQQAGLNAAATKKVMSFAEMISRLAGDLDRPVAKVLEDVVKTSGLEDALSAGDEETRQARANVAELVSSAAEFDARSNGARLSEYLHEVSLVSDVDHFEGGGAVSLMTLHAAKGLEFPHVFIIGCEQGLLPFERMEFNGSQQQPRDWEEERRLAFVGMTRAMEELTMTCVRQRMIRGRTMPQIRSPFLSEIGTENVQVEDLTVQYGQPRRPVSGGGFYGDVADREAIEALNRPAGPSTVDFEDQPPPDMPEEYQYLRPGCWVYHQKFGRGRVVKLRQGWPQTRADVIFEKFGAKTIVLSITPLELIDG